MMNNMVCKRNTDRVETEIKERQNGIEMNKDESIEEIEEIDRIETL